MFGLEPLFSVSRLVLFNKFGGVGTNVSRVSSYATLFGALCSEPMRSSRPLGFVFGHGPRQVVRGRYESDMATIGLGSNPTSKTVGQ